MTRSHIAAAVLILTVSSVSITEAQGGRRGAGRGQGAHKRAADVDLNLTADQRAQLQTLDSDMKTRLDGIQAQAEAGDIGGDEARALTRGVRDEYRTQRQAVFTPEQRQLIDESRPDGGGRGGRGDDFGQLDLSEDQRSRLESMREEHRRAMDALRESGDATREDIQQLRTEQREEAEGILDEGQRQQLQQNHEQRRQDGQGRARRGGGGGRGGRRR